MNPPDELKQQVQKCTNLGFLTQLTKGNPKMIMEMLKVYLEENPKLLNRLRTGLDNMDWDSIARTAHAIIPSFSTLGMDKSFATMARRIQELAEKKEEPELIRGLFSKIEAVCLQANEELEQELVVLEKL